jgi:ubiquinone/menaquinone biosynthesis C-methylase UbiE
MWRKVWEKKGNVSSEGLTLKELMSLDGFDSNTGQMNENAWMEIMHVIKDKLQLCPNQRFLEVGCGSGAILLKLSEFIKKIVGVDYSRSLVKVANHVLPTSALVLASEAQRLPLKDCAFDSVLSCGVFLYFPDYDYAKNALEEMVRVAKPNARILIMDIPDQQKKIECERYRSAMIGKDEYKKRYQDLAHLYYDKNWFMKLADNLSLGSDIFDQNIKGYGNSPFRFNVLLNKG